MKEHAQALAEADRCLELAPDDQLCHAIRGIALHGLERRMQALAAFDRAVELGEPQPDPTTLGWRALVRRAENDKHGALRDLDRALELRPDDAELLFLRGVINDELGRTTAAETDWRAAERLDREHVNAQLRAQPHLRQRVRQALGGEAAQQPPPQPPQPQPRQPPPQAPPRQGNSELAARVEARAQRVPEDARAGVREALVRAIRGRPWREIEAALAGVREGPEVLLERARLSLGRDAHAAAEQALAALRAAGGAGAEVGRLEGELSLRRGRLSDAERRYRAVAEAEPDHVEGLVALAEAERLRGRPEKAAAAVEAALALDPQHTAALVLQAELLLGRDPPEPDAAREVLQRALTQLGLIDSRAVTVELLCIGHQTIRSLTEGDPTSVFRVGGFMREVTVLREVSEGAAPSLALASMILDAQLPGFALQGAQDLFLRARELEPDRPDLHLVQGRLELASVRSRADDVLASWRRARQEPLLRLPPRVVLEFRQRFGPSAELDALLQDR
ncbi:MAG: tetratricopeptide repeat protein [Planctomycetes bacterium]|nr:tetratricopeptide repeat protein [Planctomycetota bacterium]